MAHSVTGTQAPQADRAIQEKGGLLRTPLQLSGALEKYEYFEKTPAIGREYPAVDLVELLEAENSDDLIRDLAIIIRIALPTLGVLSGKPSTSGLHIHPVLNNEREGGGDDPHISSINSDVFGSIFDLEDEKTKKQVANVWHSDVAFEPVPADYTSLKLVKLPRTGGDTLWASGYDIYDKISKQYQRFLETLTGTFAQPSFYDAARRGNFKLYDKERGSPENVGLDFKAVHPVVRTNPVTRWKIIYPLGNHIQSINGLTHQESTHLIDWFYRIILENHDIQVRHHWENKNDIAIWDNRSTFHCATYDTAGYGTREGHRALGVGERPYYDPNSSSRKEFLAAEATAKAKAVRG
ncbi:TfdA family Taurine catabolism dioxygenase TauD [Phlyctema vagabunda]|uniref:TfdA family Taurine catabolism dioxygenase TauD n=1 Tax=Phlyctema vagabunda TaxID=108571 RepID=A0ABR4PQA1_9HELO